MLFSTYIITMIDSILTFFFGSKKDRDIKNLLPIVEKVNAEESWAASLSETEVKEATNSFKQDLQNGKTLDDILPKAFALAREAAKRVLGERPYDTQIMGSLVLHYADLQFATRYVLYLSYKLDNCYYCTFFSIINLKKNKKINCQISYANN